MSVSGIPTVDLSLFNTGGAEDRKVFIQQLGEAFHNVGFVGVINHGIPKQLVDNFYNYAKTFFALGEQVKRQYEIEGLAGQRGYTSFGKEHAKHTTVADLKEFFQIGQTVLDGDAVKADYPDNVETDVVPEFSELGTKLYKQFEVVGGQLLEAIAIYLNLEKNYFSNKIHNGNSILRAIHYPPILKEPESAIRAEQHEDINLITLLVGASAGGLQLLNNDNEWIDINATGDAIVVNVGDMLQRLTNNYLASTTHRVVNPPRELWHTPRLSIPFFLHPKATMDLSCLDQCVTEKTPIKYAPITAGEYLNERLREIGLKK